MDRNILSTSPLHQSLIDKLAEHNMSVDVSSMVTIEPVVSEALTRQLSELFQQPLTVVFTSTNAVNNVVAAANGVKPNWRVFCTSKATADAVTSFLGSKSIVATADNASKLADKVIKDRSKNVVFFCGDKHRYELPDKLIRAKVGVQKVVVYKTITTSAKMTKFYDAILFFSPSGVDSFVSENEFAPKTVLFAIGNTTGYALKDITRNRIIVSTIPAKENLIDTVVSYFDGHENQ